MRERFADRDPIRIKHPEVPNEDALAWFSRAAGKLRTLWLSRTYPFATFAKGAWTHYSFHVTRAAAPFISIGAGVGFGRDVRLEVCQSVGTQVPALILDAGSGLQRRCVISARNRIHVMRNVIFGPSVLVTDHRRDATSEADANGFTQDTGGGTIRIEEECWIGFGATIVCEKGELIVGRHSVVGANSVVRKSVPSYSVVSGDPAKIVRQYDFSKQKWVLGCVRTTDIEKGEAAGDAKTSE